MNSWRTEMKAWLISRNEEKYSAVIYNHQTKDHVIGTSSVLHV